MHHLLLILLVYSCWACDATPSQNLPSNIQQSSIKEVIALPTAAVVEEEKRSQATKDSVEVPTFTVVLKPSASVKQLLETGTETFTLSIALVGTPKENQALASKDYYSAYDEVIYLLNKRYTITNPNEEFVLEEQISKEAFEALAQKDYKVAIDGFSGRKSSPNNIFHTTLLSGTINQFQGKKHVLSVTIL